jgi:L-aspartate oxidase
MNATAVPGGAPLVAGAGIAGLWTAWRLASEGRSAVLLTKGALADSASAWAQGGIAVALAPGDSPGQHAADTLAAGHGLSDPEAVRILTTEGPDRIRELVAMGAEFDRGPDGQLRFGLEAAHNRARIIHAGGDRTGALLVATLIEIVLQHPEIEILDYTEVKDLLEDDGRIAGVRLVQHDGGVTERWGSAVVLATGGVGQLFEVTTNPLMSTGDGWALACHAGAELRDLEFLQFHPTALRLPGVNPAPLISEAVRGAGATLVDQAGRRFALDDDPRGELAPRDIVARAVARADSAGGAFLDARSIADFAEKFPGIHAMLAAHQLDPATDLLPIAPALHYAMGGIGTDMDGRTSRRGLYACGEVACTGVHGANRLASNSLLEGLVFADRVARAIAGDRTGRTGRTDGMDGIRDLPAPPALTVSSALFAMRHIMTTDVGVMRTEDSLLHAERELARLDAQVPREDWRTRNQLLVARLISREALERRESVGGHARLDYPASPATTTEPIG